MLPGEELASRQH